MSLATVRLNDLVADHIIMLPREGENFGEKGVQTGEYCGIIGEKGYLVRVRRADALSATSFHRCNHHRVHCIPRRPHLLSSSHNYKVYSHKSYTCFSPPHYAVVDSTFLFKRISEKEEQDLISEENQQP